MAGEAEVQVSHFLDEHGLGSFQIKLIIWSVVIAMIDGYDIGAIAFAAPHLMREWHVTPKELGLVLSASNFGVLFGSQIFGWVGDRYGRKTALIACNFLFGAFTFAAAYSTNIKELFWLRFIAGLGIGGVIPNVVSINAEIGAAQSARDARDHRRRPGAHRRRIGRLRQRDLRSAIWLARHFPNRRRRSDRRRARRYLRPSRIDQIHDAARKPARENGSTDRGDPSRFQGAAQCALRDRGRKAVAELQSDLSVRQRPGRDHAADLADVRLQPDGLFLPHQLDTDAD